MTKQISIQIHRLVDVDFVEEGVPYIQIKPDAGVDWSADTKAHKSTGNGIRKRDNTFEWDADVSDCVLTFTLDEEGDVGAFVAAVNVYFDNDGGVSRYDGVGKLELLEEGGADDAICTLYDNGDEDLPSFGDVVFSYQVTQVENEGEGSIGEDDGNVAELKGSGAGSQRIDDDDDPTHWTEEFDEVHQCTYYFNHAQMASTWVRPRCLDATPTSSSSRAQSVFSGGAAAKSPQVHLANNYDVTANNTTDFSGSGIPFGTTGSNLSATLKTGSNTQSQTTQHSSTKRAPNPNITEEESVSEPTNVAPKSAKKMRKKTPAWAKYTEYSNELNALVNKTITGIKPDSCNFGIRVHSMMCSNTHGVLDLETVSSGQLKVSIQPFPGKGHVLKTNICDVGVDGMLNFDFSLQTVQLSMGVAELRSTVFANGVCPSVVVEFTCKGVTSKGCMFLPELLRVEESHLVWVNMLAQEDKHADGSSRVNITSEMKSTLILEVVKSTKGKSSSATVSDSSVAAASPQSSKKRLQVNTGDISPCSVLIDIEGIAAKSKLKMNYDSCVLEATLSCSGQVGIYSMTSKSAFKEGATVNTSFTLISDFPKLDIVFVKIFEVTDTACLVGCIEVPVSVLAARPEASAVDLSGAFRSFKVERPPVSKAGVVLNKVNFNDWAVVCSVQSAALDDDEERESPISNFLGQTALTTLNEEGDEGGDAFEPRGPSSNIHMEKRQFETVNSVDGSLLVCVHGFLPKQGSTGPSLGKADSISVDFALPNSMHPLKESTEVARVCGYPEGKDQVTLCSLWEKEFSFPVVWALQQRFVGFLQGSVYRLTPSTEKTGGAIVKGGVGQMRRVLMGYITLDIASMVNLHGDAIVCTLPVMSRVCGDEDYQSCSGHVMLGLQFTDRHAPPVVSAPSGAGPRGMSTAGTSTGAGAGAGGIKIKPVAKPPLMQSKQAWGGDASSPKRTSDSAAAVAVAAAAAGGGRGKLNQQMSPLPLPVSAFSDVKKACMERWPQFCYDVVTGYATLCDNDNDEDQDEDGEGGGRSTRSSEISEVSVSLSSIEVVAGPLRNIDDEEQIFFHLSSNDKAVCSSGAIDLDTGKIFLETRDLNMPVNMKSNTSILVLMKITKAEDDEVLGVASLVLPRKLVITGKPMNIAVPMRDSSGVKIAVVICGVHFSSMGQTLLEDPKDESETGSELQVCVIEGSILDSVWTSSLEPFFECSLKRAVHCGPATSTTAAMCVETSSVDLQASGNWNATCNVPIPKEAIVDPVSTKQASTPLWSLQIVCRDAGRRECPEVSRTQVNIPWSLLSAGKPIEQWVNLIPTTSSNSGVSLIVDAEDEDGDNDSGESEEKVASQPPTTTTRLHIRIDKVDVVDRGKRAPFQGAGHMVMWFHSIREGEQHNEKVFPALDILSAESSVRSVDTLNDYYEHDSGSEVPFSVIHIETRQSIFVANKVADVLCGSVAVPGGHSLNHLRITARHQKVALLASLPTLATLPKPTSDSSLCLEVPMHEAVLRPDIAQNYTSAGSSRQRLSRLKLAAVYVPYVVGVLHVEHSRLELYDTVADKFLMSPMKNGALRYSLGGVGSCFTSAFRMSVHQDGTTTVCSDHHDKGGGNASVISQLSNYPGQPKLPKGGKRSTSFERPGRNSKTKKGVKSTDKLRSLVAANKNETISDPQYIFVDTYELLSQAAKGKSSCGDIFDLTVNLIDLDACGAEYCMGSGQIKTAPLYFQALRMILSTTQNSGKSISEVSIPSTLPTEVQIFDKSRRMLIGTVQITLKFDITSIPLPVINTLKSFKNALFAGPAATGAGGLGRAELGLKQAYQVADKDKSGGINMGELTAVLESISSMRKKKSSKEIVGMDDGAIALLVGLMGLINGAKANGDVDYNRDEIIKLFRTMDLDGDGNVSWWEWKQVLEAGFAVMLMKSEQQAKGIAGNSNAGGQHIYPLDPLLVTLEAVHAALMAKYGGIIHKKRDLPVTRAALVTGGASPSSSDKLKDKIAQMKSKNIRLQLKLDAAKSAEGDALSPQRQRGNDSDVYRSVKAEEQAKQARELLAVERKRRLELEVELEKMQYSTDEVSRSRSMQNITNQHSLLKLHAEADKLRQEMVLAQMTRRQHNNSALIIQKFFFMVHEKFLLKKELDERNRLKTGMESLILRRRYKNKLAERMACATKIQCRWRIVLAKRRMRILWNAVHKIHEFCLLRKLRKAAGKERDGLLERLFLSRLEEAAREKKRLEEEEAERLRLEKIRREAAAVKIQAVHRGSACRRARSLQVPEEEEEVEVEVEELDELSLSKDEFLEEEDADAVMILRTIPRPDAQDAVGRWVSHPRTVDEAEGEIEQASDDSEREALVESIDLDTLRMRVLYQLEEPTTEAFFQYDDPTLTWLKECSEREIMIEIRATTKIQAAWRGRRVRLVVQAMRDAKQAELDRLAKIQRDEEEKIASTKIQAIFRGRRGRQAALAKRLAALETDSVMTDGLEVVARPPVNLAPGHWVRLPSEHDEGLVDRVDPSTGVMTVMYDMSVEGEDDIIEERNVEYSLPDLVWLRERRQVVDSQDDLTFLSLDSDLEMVKRPPMKRAPGHWVKVRGEEHEGLVDRVDLRTGVMTVMYDVEGDVDVDGDGDGEVVEAEERKVDYSLPGVVWLLEKRDPGATQQDDKEEEEEEEAAHVVEVQKPPLKLAAGHWIKVGVDGEEGLVDKVNSSTGMMKVLYDAGGGLEEDGEDAVDPRQARQVQEDYNNPAIIWIKYED